MGCHKTKRKPLNCIKGQLKWATQMQCSILLFVMRMEMVFHKTNRNPLNCIKGQLTWATLMHWLNWISKELRTCCDKQNTESKLSFIWPSLGMWKHHHYQVLCQINLWTLSIPVTHKTNHVALFHLFFLLFYVHHNLRASASCPAACFPLTFFGREGAYCAITYGLWLLKECSWEGWRGKDLKEGRCGDKVMHGNSKQPLNNRLHSRCSTHLSFEKNISRVGSGPATCTIFLF